MYDHRPPRQDQEGEQHTHLSATVSLHFPKLEPLINALLFLPCDCKHRGKTRYGLLKTFSVYICCYTAFLSFEELHILQSDKL